MPRRREVMQSVGRNLAPGAVQAQGLQSQGQQHR